MAHQVKRCKNLSEVVSSDQPSSSLCGDPWSSWTGFSNNKTELCLLGISPAEQVFGIDWIREEILHYAISDNKQNVSRNVIKNVRLVQKSWLLTTTKLLKKMEKPVIDLKLSYFNSLNAVNVVHEAGKLLNRFNQTFKTSQAIVESAIPFKLNLGVGFFWEANYQSLVDCLTGLGPYLYELEIAYPVDGGTLPVNFPHLNLPALRKFSFQFSDEKTLEEDDEDDIITFGNNARGLWLLQSILNATKRLKCFVYPFIERDVVEIPKDFEFLLLPPTISDLEISSKLNSKDLRMLLTSSLPNLKILKLLLHETPLEDDLLHKILERVQTTLTNLFIGGMQNEGEPLSHTYLRFPVMKHLKKIDIISEECELGPGEVLGLHECLPQLKSLKLTSQTEIAFKKWITNSYFEQVEDLVVALVDEDVEDENDDKYKSLDTELINGMHTSFPNVRILRLTFNVNRTRGLNCLFKNMTQLVTLRINFTGDFDEYSSDIFDSTVLCLPVELVSCLGEHVAHFENIEFKSSNQESIRNLSGLTKLVLWTDSNLEDENESLLSEVLIKYGLLKMPKLQRLSLFGWFKPSREISTLWEDSGRCIEYQLE